MAAAIRRWFAGLLAAGFQSVDSDVLAIADAEPGLGKGIFEEGWWAAVLIELRHILRNGLIAAARQGVKGASRQLGVSLDWNMLLSQTVEWAEAHAGELVQRVGDDVKQAVKRAVTDGLMQGWDTQRIAERIRAETGLSDWRAERIARTEVITAHAQGARASYEASGTVRGLRWLDGQAEACPLCRQLHNQTRRLDEPFYVDRFGHGLPPRHPNCRCTVAPVTLDEVKRLPADHPLRDNRRSSVAELTDRETWAEIGGVLISGQAKRHWRYRHWEQFDVPAAEEKLAQLLSQPTMIKERGGPVYVMEHDAENYLIAPVTEDGKLLSLYIRKKRNVNRWPDWRGQR